MSILISWLGPLRAICMAIDGIVFSLLDNAYMLVIKLSTAELFQHETIRSITNNLYILFGVVAFFRLALVLVNAIIDPEKLNEKGKGISNIFFRVVGMIMLLAVTPFLFQMSYDLQKRIVGADPEQNLIFKTILGDNANISGENAGKALQNIALSSLITIDKNYLKADGKVCEFKENDDGTIDYNTIINENDCGFLPLTCIPNGDDSCTNQGGYIFGGECTWDNCQKAVSKYNEMYVNEDMSPFKLSGSAGVSKKIEIDGEKEEVYVYNYMFIITGFVGGFMTYIIISFAIDIAVRMFELFVLEVLSPLFIATFVDPKSAQSGPFKNWLSAVGKSYANLYIKLAILALMILLVALINQSKIFTAMSDLGGWVKIFAVIGLLIFAKKAPKWIMDMIGIKSDDSGLGGLSIGKKLGGMALAGGAAKWAGDKLKKGGRALGGAAIGSLAKTAAGRRSVRDAQKKENKARKERGEKRPKGQYLQNWKDRAKGGLRAGGEGFVEGFRQGGKTDKAGDLLKMPSSMYSEGRKSYTPEYESISAKVNAQVDRLKAGGIEKSFGSEYSRQEREKDMKKLKDAEKIYGKDAVKNWLDKNGGERNKGLTPVGGKEWKEAFNEKADPMEIFRDIAANTYGAKVDSKGLMLDASGNHIKLANGDIMTAKDFCGEKSARLVSEVESFAASNATNSVKELQTLSNETQKARDAFASMVSDFGKLQAKGLKIDASTLSTIKNSNSDLTDILKKMDERDNLMSISDKTEEQKDRLNSINAQLESDSVAQALSSLNSQDRNDVGNYIFMESNVDRARDNVYNYERALENKFDEIESVTSRYAADDKNNPYSVKIGGESVVISKETMPQIETIISGLSGKEASKKEDLEKIKAAEDTSKKES